MLNHNGNQALLVNSGAKPNYVSPKVKSFSKPEIKAKTKSYIDKL